MIKRTTTFLLLILVAAACTTNNITKDTQEYSNPLIAKIDSVFNAEDFSHAFWGAKIKSLKTGDVWYTRNADKLFMPASNQKIPTSAAGLLILGPEFRYTSTLSYSGEIKDSVLNGSLILYSNGDPTLYTRLHETPLVLFNKYAEALKNLGIKKVNGNIYGDDRAFEDDHLGYGWAFDGLSYWYSAPFGPLQVNENYVDYKVIPGMKDGEPATLKPNIPTSYHSISNELISVDSVEKRGGMYRELNSEAVHFEGEVKAGGRSFEWSPTVNDPTRFYLHVFKETLEREGIAVSGCYKSAYKVQNFDNITTPKIEIVRHYSPELKEILKVLMKKSQNVYAETIARTISWYKEGEGKIRNSRSIIYDKLKEFGLEPGTYLYRDGSGLSRYNYISPSHLTKILEGMYKSEYKDIWLDIQPLAGVDGTLKRRMKGTAAEGNVRAKTGTISNVRGLSGYVTTADGEEVVFSFLVNAHKLSSRDTERITDKVLELIAEYKAE